MNLQQAGEFNFIKRVQKRFPPTKGIPLGMGDDAAAVSSPAGKLTLLTTDTLVEHVHFERSFSSFAHIGYKALAVNLSDIAAMGGTPRYFLVSLGVSGQTEMSDMDQLYRGIAKGAKEAGVDLVGGNTALSENHFFLTITLVGEVSKNEVLCRSGANEGDALFVTGVLGDAAAGLSLLENKQPGADSKLTGRYRRPRARVSEGRLLAKARIPSAMIDISDGLTADLAHLTKQSNVGAEIGVAAIPISRSLRRYSLQTGCDPLKFALYGGEDYELLFSVPPHKISKLKKYVQNGLIQAVQIGTIVSHKKGLVLRQAGGGAQKIKPSGYDHFR
ncbi:MAG: thiamine-phosphate kinase [Nitrospiria bacterium]